MLPYILGGIAVVLVLFVIVVSLRPAEFLVTRSLAIGAPARVVFDQVNDLHLWEPWSPWAKLDPNSRATFDGPPSGQGTSMAWAGNNKVGEGRMTIVESRPHELIRFRLEFLKPMKATNSAEFTFKPDAGRTLVTWSMSGRNGFVGKLFGMFVNCDAMVGGQFEQGLASLKQVAESAARG